MAGLLSMMVPVLFMAALMLVFSPHFTIARHLDQKCCEWYARSHVIRGGSKVKEGVEHHEVETEHTINELLVFVTEHLPHLLAGGGAGH